MKQDHGIITVMNAKSMLHFKVLNYTLIAIDKNEMQSKGVKPILADSSQLPVVQPYDEVYMIHHPEKMKKNFSQDKARRVIGPYIVYLANTLEGPPGSPVFVFKESKFLLIAMHSGLCRIEGVLVSDILDNLHMGKGKTCFFLRFPAFNCKSGKIICQVEPCVCSRSDMLQISVRVSAPVLLLYFCFLLFCISLCASHHSPKFRNVKSIRFFIFV